MLINNCSQDKHSVSTSEDKFKRMNDSDIEIAKSSTNTNQTMKVWITRTPTKTRNETFISYIAPYDTHL
jgi:hypothetical protein